MFLSITLIVSILLTLRCKAGEYDPTGRIYPWPLPEDRQSIFFSLIVSFGETFNSSGIVPGVNVALDVINSNESNLLEGYSLHYVLSDSQCSRTTALDVFFRQILSETEYTKLAVIGAGCSPATEPTAEVSHQFNITQISCASSSPVLSDRTRFKKYFQLLPSMADLAHGYVGVFRHYSWRQVTLIVQEENLFTEMIGRLKELLSKEDIMYTEHTFSTDIGLTDLRDEPFSNSSERIYLIATFENYARALLCEAFHLSIQYPTHLLLTFQWYDKKWWLKENNSASGINLTCSGKDRESVLPYSLAFDFVQMDFVEDQNVMTDVGITSTEYLEREREHLGIAPHYLSRSLDGRYCFDATFTLTEALTRTLTDVRNTKTNSRLASAYGSPNETSFGLEHFNYMSDALTNITFLHLTNTSFIGITGDVSFNENGVRRTDYLSVYQFRNVDGDGLNLTSVGRLTMPNGTDDYTFTNDTLSAVWPNGTPYDGVPREKIVTAHIAVVVIIYIFAAAGLIFSIVCLTFNFAFRNTKLIRLSSPKLNNITVFGVIILYVAMVLFAIPTHSESVVMGLCIARLWFLSLGVSLAFGTIIMKMFRVCIIFSNPSPKRKKFIKDWMLALVVFIMVIIDLVVLVIFTAVVMSLKLDIVQLVPNKEKPQSEEGETKITTKFCIHICRSTAERIAVAILSVYKGLLQLAALVLAIHTQRVRVKGLDDAKYIIAAVYASSLGLILATVTHFAVLEYENLHAVLFAIAAGGSSTAILGFTFIPKMIGLYKDPKGENVLAHHSSSGDALASIGGRGTRQQLTRIVDSQSTEDSLRKRIKDLEGIISRYSGGEYGSTTDSSTNSMARHRVPSSSRGTNGDLEVCEGELPLKDKNNAVSTSEM